MRPNHKTFMSLPDLLKTTKRVITIERLPNGRRTTVRPMTETDQDFVDHHVTKQRGGDS